MANLIIHGGAGRLEGLAVRGSDYSGVLQSVYRQALEHLLNTGDPRGTVILAVRLMESHELFNAGKGSRLQRDGKIRMSAALVDGARNHFSGVINVTDIEHPIELAAHLAGEAHTVLAAEEAVAYARGQGFAPFDPITEHRSEEYRNRLEGMGTVGAVAVGDDGRIFAATSTGGVGFEIPGRVSDSPTVAGTYATLAAGVSCTGIGEQIVNLAAAARVAVRATDGSTIGEAVRRTIDEGTFLGYSFGLIALDRDGRSEVGETAGTTVMYARGGEDGTVETFLTGRGSPGAV